MEELEDMEKNGIMEKSESRWELSSLLSRRRMEE